MAGIDEVRNEVTKIADFLRGRRGKLRLGAQIPRGVLLSVPLGTGKTLLAPCPLWGSGVPLLSTSASEFIEMIADVGASRVRHLFEQAKTTAPSIIFIDEPDAIRRARGDGPSTGGHEREQTLNQVLTELEGFTGSEGVVMLAATDRPEILDAALLRPGRRHRSTSPARSCQRRLQPDVAAVGPSATRLRGVWA